MSKRGFASMDPSKQRQIASKGGKAAHEKGTAHQFSSAEASAAGKKGGSVVSQNRQHMSDIGRIGGKARGSKAFVPPALHGMDLADAEAPTQRPVLLEEGETMEDLAYDKD